MPLPGPLATTLGKALGVAVAAAAVVGVVLRQRRSCRLPASPHTTRSNAKLPQTVVITGGCGNLGIKLATHLLQTPDAYRVVLLEHPAFFFPDRVPAGAAVVLGDCADGSGAWVAEALEGADCVVHFSAVNPYPNATWAESAASMRHTFNVLTAAKRCGVRRVVFASSNHVMGQYKDDDDPTDPAGAGLRQVRPSDPPRCGTPLRDPAQLLKSGDAVAYAAAKLAGEQLCHCLASQAPVAALAPSRQGNPPPRAATTFVVLRVGWCQPGANRPSTLCAAGAPPECQSEHARSETSAAAAAPTTAAHAVVAGGGGAQDDEVDAAWFKHMWLSNRDFARFFEAALRAPITNPAAALVLNAMSNNCGMRWSIAETEAALGVKALDNSNAA